MSNWHSDSVGRPFRAVLKTTTARKGRPTPGGPAVCQAPAGSRSDKKPRHPHTIPAVAFNIFRS